MIGLHPDNISANNHFTEVKDLIQTRIKNILARGIKRKKKPVPISRELKIYLNSLLVDANLKLLIEADADNLKNIISFFAINNPDFIKPKSNANFILANVFIAHGYENPAFNELNLIETINIDTCPYCNRSYIYYLSDANEIKPPIDHFFPRNKYPFLGVSFYNLIPSCQTCNGFGAKEEKDPLIEDLVNPYLIKNTDFRISYSIKSVNVLNPLRDKNSVAVYFTHKLQGHLNVYKLEKFYEQHSDHALELIIKSKLKYSEEYRSYLKKYTGLKFSDIEIDRLILGNYSEEHEIHNRPLAKLYQDIGRELGLIK